MMLTWSFSRTLKPVMDKFRFRSYTLFTFLLLSSLLLV